MCLTVHMNDGHAPFSTKADISREAIRPLVAEAETNWFVNFFVKISAVCQFRAPFLSLLLC